MNMSERIAYALARSGRTPRDLSKDVGVSVARISQLKSGAGGIKAENLFALARATGCSAQWLAEGAGKPTEDETSKTSCVLISHYDTDIDGQARRSLPFDLEWLTELGLSDQSLRYMTFTGGTMEPVVGDADVLLIDVSQVTPESGAVFAVHRADGNIVVKRLLQTMTNGWLIRSDNENKRHYPDEVVPDSEIGSLKIAGRVVWRGGKV